jgi:hypothetical protein
MSDPVDALLLDLVGWIAQEERSYAEVMEAWRTSCRRLPVWEEANARGLVTRKRGARGEGNGICHAGWPEVPFCPIRVSEGDRSVCGIPKSLI